MTFDWSASELRFAAASFHVERELGVYLNGALVRRQRITPGEPQEIVIEMHGGMPKSRVDLEVDSCTKPSEVGKGSDRRCIGYFLFGITPERRELFQVDRDPREALELSAARPAIALEMEKALARYQWRQRQPAERRELSDEQVEQLRALGYLQ